MPLSEIDGRAYEVDENGFFQDSAIWDEAVAVDFSKLELPDPTPSHCKVISYVGTYYLRLGIAR